MPKRYAWINHEDFEHIATAAMTAVAIVDGWESDRSSAKIEDGKTVPTRAFKAAFRKRLKRFGLEVKPAPKTKGNPNANS